MKEDGLIADKMRDIFEDTPFGGVEASSELLFGKVTDEFPHCFVLKSQA